MKLSRIFVISVVLLPSLLSVDQVDSQFLSSGLMLLTILGGFFMGHVMGQMALSAFIVMLMAIVPPDEARSLSRISRSTDEISSASINDTIRNFTIKSESVRQSRFITELLRADPLNCMPQVMCELSSAKEPSTRTDTINDYKYLMREMIESDEDADDENDKESPLFRTNTNNQKSKSKNVSKSKHKNNRKKDADDSSPETDESLSKESDEQKKGKVDPIQDEAEFMELELEDALEERAWKDLVNEDPGDLGYAIADMKRKEKIQQMVNKGEFDPKESDEMDYKYLGGNTASYKRNIEILEKRIEENNKQGVFRSSRAFQDSFVSEKQRELTQTKDIYDRVRIAAEVANVTRNGRKCRALFNECPLGGSGINKVVNNIRKAIVGTPVNKNKKKTESNRQNNNNNKINVNDLQAIVNQMQPAGGTNVKVTLNIGNDPRMGMMAYPYYAYPAVQSLPNISTTTSFQTQNVSKPASAELIQATEISNDPESSGEIVTLASDNILDGMVEVSLEIPDNENSTSLEQVEAPVPKPKTRDEKDADAESTLPNIYSLSYSKPKVPSKTEYKNVLIEASHLIKDLKSSSSKNPSGTVTPNPIYKKVHQQIEELIHKIDPKGKINVKSDNSDSEESDESSEEVEPLVSLPPSKRKHTRAQTSKPKKSSQPPPLHPPKHLAKRPSRIPTQKTSWIGSVYDIFFRDKQTAPLPSKTEEYIPSAQRHAFRSAGIQPHSMYPNSVNNYERFDLPYANDYYASSHDANFGNSNHFGKRRMNLDTSEEENESRESHLRNARINTEKRTTIKPKVRRVMKYKNGSG